MANKQRLIDTLFHVTEHIAPCPRASLLPGGRDGWKHRGRERDQGHHMWLTLTLGDGAHSYKGC